MQLPGYFVAAGMNSGGIASAGGVGKVMAEWIISGDPPAGTWPVDIRRFGEMHNNRRYLRERVKEILRESCLTCICLKVKLKVTT